MRIEIGDRDRAILNRSRTQKAEEPILALRQKRKLSSRHRFRLGSREWRIRGVESFRQVAEGDCECKDDVSTVGSADA